MALLLLLLPSPWPWSFQPMLLLLIFLWLTLSLSLMNANPLANPANRHLKLRSKLGSPTWVHNSTVIQSFLPCLAQLTLWPPLLTPFIDPNLTLHFTATKSAHLIPLLQMTPSLTPLTLLLDHCYNLAWTCHPKATTIALLSAPNSIPPGVILS